MKGRGFQWRRGRDRHKGREDVREGRGCRSTDRGEQPRSAPGARRRRSWDKRRGRHTVTNGDLWARQLKTLVLLTPPPLLGVVFPWNHERRFLIEKKLDGGTMGYASRVIGNTFNGGTGGVVLSGVQGLRGHNVHSRIFRRRHRATKQQQ
ncbi:hypothetical protein PIB30_060304, partial [Stylosanthes scabra]|nr:hypothetical protein [Stylosanthes scabra]